MKLSKSSKKVSWAPDANLCQAKLFRSKDCPSLVCLKARDGLLAKKSWILHSDGLDTNGLPHGFKDTRVNQSKKKVSHIPKIKWKCPPKFVLSSNWLVASGEESQEAEAQKLRENHVVEAVYPRISAIPLSPSISLDIEECHQDDCDIPLVPITSMEDEGTVDTLFDLAAPINSSMISKPPALSQDLLASGNTSQCDRPVLEPPAIEKTALGLSPDVEADIIAAATAAITMVMRCKEQGSSIDTDLLIKILTNPKMTEKLINGCREPGGTSTIPLSESKPVTQLVTVSCSEPAIVLEPRPANENMCYQPKRVRPALDSRSPQEDTFPVSRSKQVAHRVPLPHTNGNMCSLPGNKRPALNSSPLQPDNFPSSCSKPVTLPKPESGNIYPLPNGMLPDSNSGLSIPNTVTVSLSPAPLPSKGPNMVLLSQPAKVNLCSIPNDVQPAINLRPPQADAVQFSRSKPANGNMYSLVDEVLAAASNSRPPQLDTVPVSSSKPVSLSVPVLPSIEVDMVASQKAANENFYPLWSGSGSTVSTRYSREPMVPLSGFNPAPLLVRSSALEPRVLSPRPTNGNLHNILKGVQPTLNTTPTLPDILPTSSFKAIKSHVKDVNYYKSLVKQHGGEKQGTQDQIIPQYANHENYLQGMELIQNFKPTELKPKSQKSCIFYNSPTGCRNGTNCPYQHDTFSQLRCGSMLEDKRAKRMKLDGKITGRK